MNKPKKTNAKSNSTKKPPVPQNGSAKPMLQPKMMGAGSGPGDPGDPRGN